MKFCEEGCKPQWSRSYVVLFRNMCHKCVSYLSFDKSPILHLKLKNVLTFVFLQTRRSLLPGSNRVEINPFAASANFCSANYFLCLVLPLMLSFGYANENCTFKCHHRQKVVPYKRHAITHTKPALHHAPPPQGLAVCFMC